MELRLPKWQWRMAAFKNGFLDATAYRIEFAIEVLGSALMPAMIQWLLWYAMFKIGGRTEVAGMSYVDMLHYTFASVLFSQVRGGDHDFELAEMIRSGALSNYLLRPISLIEFVWIRGISSKVMIALACLVIGMIVSAIAGFSPLRMFGAMALALIGNIIHYQIGAALASASFYWEESYSLMMVKNMIVGILSGELIPLNLVPEAWSWVWKSTPFYLYVFGPTQYALGRWSQQEFFHHLGLSMIWLFVGWVLIKISWGIGIRRYLSLGG